jgi:NAD(P)-dependent dehydrogenase (short-subunit alcohol dehydrogenase family)
MSELLEEKVAIVTGGASGIGEACVRAFVGHGAQVIIADVDSQRGPALAGELGCVFHRHDVTRESDWQALAADAMSRYGRLDALVNNAGVVFRQSIEDIQLDDWKRVMEVNLTGVMLGCKHAVRTMKLNPSGPAGSIINVSSIAGFIGMPDAAAYNASKGAVRHLSKSVAVYCAERYGRIRCNSLHPGTINTPILQSRLANSDDADAAVSALNGMQPVGRMGAPAEIANCAVFLASELSSFVTGTELIADGGWLAEGGILRLPKARPS